MLRASRIQSLAGRGAMALLLVACASCAGYRRWPWSSTHALPGPMERVSDPLPRGDLDAVAPGPEDVLIVRHADPVAVRPAGAPAPFPLSFHKNTVRAKSGAAAYGSPGSRLEVLWPNGMHVVQFGHGSGLVGSPSRGEPSYILRQVERAEIHFKDGEEVELLGGGRLSSTGGPFLVSHVRERILRVENRGKDAGRLAFRDEAFELDPGIHVDLALLSVGGAPFTPDPALQTVQGPGFPLQHVGAVEVEPGPDGLVARASGTHEIHALGVRLQLDRDESASFASCPPPPPPPPPPAEPVKKP